MQTIFQLPDICKDDAATFQAEVDRFKSGETSGPEFRSFRVPMGVYEQREPDTFMLRVRFPAGSVLPHQMQKLADVSRKYGNGVLHVTSRQDIQVHQVLVDDIAPAIGDLYEAGLSTRGGGGNTVRNISGCYDAGVCADEAFDPTGHAVALSEFLLPDPLSYQLPRKYKIAFSACSRDCAAATVNDVGFIARRRGEELGFAVYVGGGMGARSRVADPFEPFVPAADVHYVAEAVKRVFDKHGNRKNRHRARLRFLLDKIGVEGFRKLYDAELAELRKKGLPKLDVRDVPVRQRDVTRPAAEPGDGFGQWRERNVTTQRQAGYHLVQIPLRLGDIPADTLEKLADAIDRYGEGMVRTTQQQNLVIRWVHENELAALHAALADLGLAVAEAPILRDLVACTGASTCKLGMCLARGLADAVRNRLEKDGRDLHGLGGLTIHISGCPNSCGRHPVADIGFFGAARRVHGRLVPHYVFQLGGKVAEGETRLAQGEQTVPAHNVPALVADFLDAYRESTNGSTADFDRFLDAKGRRLQEELAAKYRDVPDFSEDKNFYYDFGADEMFSLAGRGPGECGAGVFDLIEVDLAGAHEAVDQGRLFEATVLASRALLVTRGQQAHGESQALELFVEHFLDGKLVDESQRPLIELAVKAGKASKPAEAYTAKPADVSNFVTTIQSLYDGMDASLRFQTVADEPAAAAPAKPEQPTATPDKEVDFRGVVCPLNYVKTKMVLDQLPEGNVLSVLLDEAGSRNVPESVAKDGHDVLSVAQTSDHWQVVIRKG
ncbi:MAG: sulfurtransferase TusA family protein [Thermoguttaceae bacterium]